jgi:putative tryptophan/tyrosine transport system substrate-binding protein
MRTVIRRLSLGFVLIALSSAVLLLSDWRQRKGGTARIRRVAIVQHASQPVLDDGVLDALAAEGFIDGRNIAIQRFNAENDLPTANTIARQVTTGEYDMVITSSTLSMQTVANANKAGRVIHVFGVVADPFSAGIGISRENPLDHPKHLVGLGSMIPVDRAFQMARTMYPGLKSVGLAWNSAESNSLAFTTVARKVCKEMGLKLMEANVESSSAVLEAATSLVARGAQALWVSGDVTVLVALESVVAAARKGRIPVFTITPPAVQRGSLFDSGVNFYDVGQQTGALAASILRGADPAKIPVRNLIPEKVAVNLTALNGLRDKWRIPPDLVAQAHIVLDEKGLHDKTATRLQPPPGRVFKLGLVYFAPEAGADVCIKGIFDGLSQQGFEEGKNLEVRRSHAQGEIANIPSVLQNYDNQDVDLILTMTTPCLTSACNTVRKKPVVFTYVYDPIAAGAGKSRTDHVPHVTGVGSFPPVADTIGVIEQIVPAVKSVGTLYNSSEANSRKVVSVARELFTKRGIKLVEVTVTGTSDVAQAAQVLAGRNIQAMWITGDNTALQAFDAIAKVSIDRRLPLINNDPEFVDRGALACVGLGWYAPGQAAAKLAARVLLGQNPRHLPIEEVAVKQLVLNHAVAQKLGVTFPPNLVKEAAGR